MNPNTVQSNTTNRNLQAQTAPAEPAVAENPLPLLDVQPVEVPQAIEIRAELAAVEDLADRQKIEAKEEAVEESLSSEKTFLDNLLSLPSELQSKILEQMRMKSLEDLAPLLEAIAQEVQMLQALEDTQRPEEKISNLRQLAQLARENMNGTLQLSASIASLLETINKEVKMLQALDGRQSQTDKISKLCTLAQLAVENVCTYILDFREYEESVQLMECKKQLSAIAGDASGVFVFKRVNMININLNHVELAGNFFNDSIISLDIHNNSTLKALSDISGLEHLDNLQRLNIESCKQLVDISGLEKFSKLTELDFIDCNQLTDISPLGQLSNLIRLALTELEQLRDVSSLGHLSKLTRLAMYQCNRLTDIYPLAQLSNLYSLMLGSAKLIDISALGELNNLQYLDLVDCDNLTDIRPLMQLSNLKNLDFMSCYNLQANEEAQQILEDLRNIRHVNIKF